MERQFREGSNGSAPKCRNPQPEVGRKQKPDFGHVLHKCSAPDANTAGNSVAHLSPFTNLLYTNLPFVRPNPLPVSAPRCPPPCRCGRLPGEDAGGHRPKARAVGAGRGASLPWQGSDPYSVCRWCVLKKNGDTSLVPLDQPPPPPPGRRRSTRRCSCGCTSRTTSGGWRTTRPSRSTSRRGTRPRPPPPVPRPEGGMVGGRTPGPLLPWPRSAGGWPRPPVLRGGGGDGPPDAAPGRPHRPPTRPSGALCQSFRVAICAVPGGTERHSRPRQGMDITADSLRVTQPSILGPHAGGAHRRRW